MAEVPGESRSSGSAEARGTFRAKFSSPPTAMLTEAPRRPLTNLLALVGLLAVGGLPTFIITVVLLSIGVSLLASGVGVFAAGVMAAAGMFQMNDDPLKAILVGPPLAAAGVVSLGMLVGYFWLAVKVTRKVLAV